MSHKDLIRIWENVIKNNNKWVLFQNGTVVIFLLSEITPAENIGNKAIEKLKAVTIRNVAVAELVGQGQGWIVNCGNDFILNYIPHGDYMSRYDRMLAIIDTQRRDQKELKILYSHR